MSEKIVIREIVEYRHEFTVSDSWPKSETPKQHLANAIAYAGMDRVKDGTGMCVKNELVFEDDDSLVSEHETIGEE